MKSVLALVMLLASVSMAASQNACSSKYTSCMDSCVAKPSPGLQNACMEGCQRTNNACSEAIYGRSGGMPGEQFDAHAEQPQSASPKKPARR